MLIALDEAGIPQKARHQFAMDPEARTTEPAVLDLGKLGIRMNTVIHGNPDPRFLVDLMNPLT